MIWKFIRSKQKTKDSIGDLLINQEDPKSEKTSCNKEKANIIADFFTSVFTIEPEANNEDVPLLEDREIQHPLENLTISEDMIEKVLKGLNPDKAPGLDGLHPRFLRELLKQEPNKTPSDHLCKLPAEENTTR